MTFKEEDAGSLRPFARQNARMLVDDFMKQVPLSKEQSEKLVLYIAKTTDMLFDYFEGKIDRVETTMMNSGIDSPETLMRYSATLKYALNNGEVDWN